MTHTQPLSICWSESIRGVALDMDGLLFDTESLYWQVGTIVLERRQRVFTDALQQNMMGRPGPEAIQVMITHEQLTDRCEDLLAEAEAEFLKLASADLKLMPGFHELIAHLDRQRIPYGVATSSRRSVAEDLLSRVALLPKLRFLLTGDDIQFGKPHPEMYLRAASALGITPTQMLVLEDSSNGCKAGVCSGACVVAVPGAHSISHCFVGTAAIASRLDDAAILALLC